jgi:hypothetical protein
MIIMNLMYIYPRLAITTNNETLMEHKVHKQAPTRSLLLKVEIFGIGGGGGGGGPGCF